MSSTSLTWLHLSDLHFNPKTKWDRERVLSTLLEDLKTMQVEQGLVPDLVFFTGDIAFGNINKSSSDFANQFSAAEEFFKEVRKAFTPEVPQDRFYIVPGNHDVDREEVADDQTAWLEKATLDDVTKIIADNSKQYSRYMERLSIYREFLKDQGYTHLLEDTDRLIYSNLVDVKGLKN